MSDNGKGHPTIIFLHYFGGSSGTWHLVVDLLSDRFRCICADLPGFGASADVAVTDYSVKSSALALGDSLSGLNAGKFILVGHSMGGKIALKYASMKPEGLQTVVLVAGSPPVPEPMTDEDRAALLEKYGQAALIRKHLEKIIHRSVQPHIIDELVADNLRAGRSAWNAWVEAGSREDISNIMTTINVPVHFIAGEQDDPLSPDYMREISRKYFPGSDVRTINNSGHLLPIEAPVELAALIDTIARNI